MRQENTPNTSLSSITYTVRFSNIRQVYNAIRFITPTKYYKNIRCYFGM